MKQAAANTTTKAPNGKATFTAGSIALTFLDTTWRMAIPVLLFTGLGIVADLSLGTKPWLTIVIGVPVGFVFAMLLIKKQLQAVAKTEEDQK